MGKDQIILFHSTIFGPVHSRRLGTSLGVNLSPSDGKVCTFDCLYCEAGFNAQGPGHSGLPTRDAVATALRDKLTHMRKASEQLDVITFSGNGEPTVHPQFAGIVDDVIALRDEFFPAARVSVLSNSTRLHDPAVCAALRKVDNNILKLDSAIEQTMRIIDRPTESAFTVAVLIDRLRQFVGQAVIQTMMLRGSYGTQQVDNTTEMEINALIQAYRSIRPREIMLYSIDRSTPAELLEKVDSGELQRIGAQIEQATGIHVQVN